VGTTATADPAKGNIILVYAKIDIRKNLG